MPSYKAAFTTAEAKKRGGVDFEKMKEKTIPILLYFKRVNALDSVAQKIISREVSFSTLRRLNYFMDLRGV